MSKAFTRESDESGAEEIPSFRPQLPPGSRNYITREGADRLRQRLNVLLEKKQALAPRINDAGTAFEADQRKIESAIRRLQQTLDAVVVAGIPADQEKIVFGATVTIRHGNGEEETCYIDLLRAGVPADRAKTGLYRRFHTFARCQLDEADGSKQDDGRGEDSQRLPLPAARSRCEVLGRL